MSKDIEKRIASIEARNKKVEQDKAWETSLLRKCIVFMITCAFSYSFLHLINDPNAFGNAILASVGFMLSTLTLSLFKNWWLGKQK